MVTAGFQSDMRDLYHFSHELLEDAGHRSCFSLRFEGTVIRTADSVLLKVFVQDAATMRFDHYGTVVQAPSVRPPKGVALLRATHGQFDTLLQYVSGVRVMQAHLCTQGHVCIIDATCNPTFLAGYIPLQAGESLRVAEIFSGAFMGWSRAAWLVRQHGVPCHTSWYLDVDETCEEPLRFWDPPIVVADSVDDIPASVLPTPSVFLRASWDASWWKAAFALRPIHMVCISPPCQPWSTASSGSGLHSHDGALIIKAFSLLGAVQVPLVALEEVSGFASHPHFALILKHINDVGYQCIWRRSLQLSEVGPVARKRFFMILKHVTHVDPCPDDVGGLVWRSRSFPSFADVKAHFEQLPEALLQPCLMSPEVLAAYLDPALFPPSRTSRPCADPLQYRVRRPDQQAECFMASYHRQHLLPQRLLQTKGLLCSILQVSQGPRFYAAPEIACAHGAVWCHFISGNDQDSMRHLGNCLAVQQAAFVVALTTQCFQAMPRLDAAVAVEAACQATLSVDTAFLVPVQRGWLLCSEAALAALSCSRPIQAQIVAATFEAPRQPYCLVFLREDLPSNIAGLAFADPCLSPNVLLGHFDIPPAYVSGDADVMVVRLPAPNACSTRLAQVDTRAAKPGRLIRFLGPDFVWFVAQGQPDTFCQAAAAFWAFAGWEVCDTACFDVYGGRVHRLSDLPSYVLVTPCADAILCDSLQITRQALEACSCTCTDDGVALNVRGPHAADWWLTWPGHLLRALGADWRFENFPTPVDESLHIHVSFRPSAAQLAVEDFFQWLRTLSFLGVLRAEVANAPLPSNGFSFKRCFRLRACGPLHRMMLPTVRSSASRRLLGGRSYFIRLSAPLISVWRAISLSWRTEALHQCSRALSQVPPEPSLLTFLKPSAC